MVGWKRMRTRVLIRFTRPWEIPKLFFFCRSEFSPFLFFFFFDIIDVRVRQDSVLCVSINKLRACEMEKEGDAGPFRSVR
jgi:hypothetical protein